MTYTILLDPGHGKDTPGKRSPKFENSKVQLLEWEFSRKVATKIIELAPRFGIKAVNIIPEDKDIALSERANRANKYIRDNKGEKCILLSIHGNAAGNGSKWMSARGWEAWTTVGMTKSDKLAEFLYEAADFIFPEGTKIRTDKSDGDKDKEKNFTVIYKAACPAVLTENFFYDNQDDCMYMLSDKGIEAIARVHILGAKRFFDSSIS